MFQKIPVSSEIEGDEPLSEYARAYIGARAKSEFYDYVLRKFEHESSVSGLTKSKLAERLGYDPARVSRLLAAPGNWTIETIAELLAGICREKISPNSTPMLDHIVRNFSQSDWVEREFKAAAAGQNVTQESLGISSGPRQPNAAIAARNRIGNIS